MFRSNQLKLLAVATIFLFLGAAVLEAKPPSRSSRPSSRSSRPSTSRPPSRPSTSKPKYGSSSRPSSSRPSTSRPSTGSKSKYGSGTSKPKYGTGSSSKPSTGSKKPSSSSSAKAKANRQSASKKSYVATKKATNPPKKNYTTASGKTVNVRSQSKTVQSMRSRPSSYYTPAARSQRISVHVTSHYSHPYSYYHSQPHYYVGGGYSSSFWYMMSEWSYQRRAAWLYHNQNTIERSAYQRGMQDAQVSAELARLRTTNTAVNTDYVDSEFTDTPGMMYSQDYVEAAYNPTVTSGGLSGALTVLVWLIVIGVVGCFAVFFITKVRFGS